MKKHLLLIIFVLLAGVLMAQSEAERASLRYTGSTTVLDQYTSPEGDTLKKIGTQSSDFVETQFFFGYSDFQVGVFGDYRGCTLFDRKYGVTSSKGFSVGVLLRQNFAFGEIKGGAGYFRERNISYGYSDNYTVFHDTVIAPGIVFSLDGILSLETLLFPRVEFQAKYNLGFTTKESDHYFEHNAFEVSADISLIRINLIPEVYLSPLIGFEYSKTYLNPVYKVGVEISGVYNTRANLLKIGYFREYDQYGVEGLFISVNPIALYEIFK